MRDTERTQRINADLDKHFKSNHGAWWVNNEFGPSNIISLHHGIGGERIDPVWVALRILRREPSVKTVHFGGGCCIYTRETLKWRGYKV